MGSVPPLPPGDPVEIAQAMTSLSTPDQQLLTAPQASQDLAATIASQTAASESTAGTPGSGGTSSAAPAGPAGTDTSSTDPDVRGVSCPTCGGSGHLAGGTETCLSCGGRGTCFPGQKACYPIEAHTAVGRFLAGLYECLCCPDPCYQPSWVPEANAGFFVDYARPQTLTRFRYDAMPHLKFPDRAEYWCGPVNDQLQGIVSGKRPEAAEFQGPRGNIVKAGLIFDMNICSFYTEAASKRGSFLVEIPYESFNAYPKAPYTANQNALRHSAGFSDMNIGTKSLLLDCELLLLTFQFRTYFPIGNVTAGLGNGHISLEPSLLATVKLGPGTYFQGQLAKRSPSAAVPGLRRLDSQVCLLVQSGALPLHTERPADRHPPDGWLDLPGRPLHNPFTGPTKASNETYFNIGPGLRMSVCNRVDFGAAVTWPV